jgi:hypothetical protein
VNDTLKTKADQTVAAFKEKLGKTKDGVQLSPGQSFCFECLFSFVLSLTRFVSHRNFAQPQGRTASERINAKAEQKRLDGEKKANHASLVMHNALHATVCKELFENVRERDKLLALGITKDTFPVMNGGALCLMSTAKSSAATWEQLTRVLSVENALNVVYGSAAVDYSHVVLRCNAGSSVMTGEIGLLLAPSTPSMHVTLSLGLGEDGGPPTADDEDPEGDAVAVAQEMAEEAPPQAMDT